MNGEAEQPRMTRMDRTAPDRARKQAFATDGKQTLQQTGHANSLGSGFSLKCSGGPKGTWTMNQQRFPAGWDEQRVKRLLAELDARTDEE